MLIFDEGRVIENLGDLHIVPRVSREWPKLSEKLPCITVTQVADAHVDYRDNAPFIDAVEMDVRIFSMDADEIESIASAVDQAMDAICYTRIMFYRDDNPQCRMLLLRYRKLITLRSNEYNGAT